MRKNKSFFVPMLVVMVFSGKVCFTAEETSSSIVNLVENPGFEKADPDNQERPAGFIPCHAGKERRAKLTWEKPGYSGKKAVAVKTFSSDDLGYWKIVVPVKPATEYIISFYYRCESADVRTKQLGDPAFNKGRPGGPNLELGVITTNGIPVPRKTQHWSDTGIPLGVDGGTYLPLATEWSYYKQVVKTTEGQTAMEIKLRLYCYAQKVWFDNLSVVECDSLPRVEMVSPEQGGVIKDGAIDFRWKEPGKIANYLLEYGPSPVFNRDATAQFQVKGNHFTGKDALKPGMWFWRVGIADRQGIPCWLGEGTFFVGGKPWISRDTTPPAVNLAMPVPGESSSGNPAISTRFADTGSGIDIPSARILLDGVEVTKQASVTQEGFTLTPEQALAKGVHRVEVSVADKAGNLSNILKWRFGVDTVPRLKTRIENKKLIVEDEPYFPVGIYAYSCHPNDDGRFRETALAEAADAGLDCLHNGSVKPEHLDILLRHRIRNLACIYYNMEKVKDADSAKAALIDQGQVRFDNHPTMLGYWGEPLAYTNYQFKMAETRKTLKEYISDRPLIYCGSDETKWKDIFTDSDISMVYRYPVPMYHPKMLYDWTLDQAQALADGKPVWFLPQAFSHAMDRTRGKGPVSQDEFRPTQIEMRTMAYFALVMKVDGLLYYALHYPHPSLPAIWKEMLKEGGEMRYLAPILAAGKQAADAQLQKDCTSASIFFREIKHNGAHTLIAVNMSGDRIGATWEFQNPTRAIVLFEDRVMSKPSKEVNDIFGPFEVHIYRW